MVQQAQDNLSSCITACQDALRACLDCAASDLSDVNPHMAQCALINLDCADACDATLKALARRSIHHGDFCALCQHLCRACAVECAKHKTDHCLRCRQACEHCAEACAKHATERHI